MADPPKRPSAADIAREARELLEPEPPKRAVPPTYPGRTGFGKQPIPPEKPPPIPLAVKSAPEATIVTTVAPPAPGSVAPPTRSLSPPPAELAPDPQSVRVARQGARERVAESERLEKSTLDSLTEIPGIRRGLSVFWRWIAPLLLAATTTIAGWLWGYAKGLAAAYERVAAIEQRAKATGERLARIEVSVEGIADAQATEARSNRAERATAKARHEQLVEDLNKAVPKIQGLAPKP